jgi:Ca-activated chloride channel family protein
MTHTHSKHQTRKTTGILASAALVAGAAFLLTAARSGGAGGPSATSGRVAAGKLLVNASLASTHVGVGTTETHMAVTVRAPEGSGAKERPPVNIAVVIDRSGSMAGEKLAQAKLAARQLVTQLLPSDRFAIVSYGTDVTVVFRSTLADPGAKEAALAAIDAIYDDGGTNLSGGLVSGRDEVLAHLQKATVSRIVLISDGLANEGITDREQLAGLARATAERGVSITTVGVGLDFDEQTMTRIAVAGVGNYYFVENAEMLATMFGAELGKLGATVATEVKVALTPAAGTEILEAYGYDLERDGQKSILGIADLHAGETRKVVLRLRVTTEKPGTVDIGTVEVAYQPVDGGAPALITFKSRAEATRSQEAILAGRDKDTTRHIERARTASTINQATSLYEKGDHDGARQLLSERREEAKALAGSMGYAELDAEISGATAVATDNIQSAPVPSATGGKRASKTNRKDAYDLMY